ncbi:MAG: hypothetical protein LBM26_03055, partial [Methanobrevibacter sp.]|nr:hypothetical protein [Methanobrevibacter sp.]
MVDEIQNQEYEKASNILKKFSSDHNIKYENNVKDEEAYNQFRDKFSPEILKNLSDDDLLNHMFLHERDKNNLCYALEYDDKYKV